MARIFAGTVRLLALAPALLAAVPAGAQSSTTEQKQRAMVTLSALEGRYLTTDGHRIPLALDKSTSPSLSGHAAAIKGLTPLYISLWLLNNNRSVAGVWADQMRWVDLAGAAIFTDRNIVLQRADKGSVGNYVLCPEIAADKDHSYVGSGLWGRFIGGRSEDASDGKRTVIASIAFRNVDLARSLPLSALTARLTGASQPIHADAFFDEETRRVASADPAFAQCGETVVSLRFSNVGGAPTRLQPMIGGKDHPGWAINLPAPATEPPSQQPTTPAADPSALTGSWVPADPSQANQYGKTGVSIVTVADGKLQARIYRLGNLAATATLSAAPNGYKGRWVATDNPALDGDFEMIPLPDGFVGFGGGLSSTDPARKQESVLYLSQLIGAGRFQRGTLPSQPAPTIPPAGPQQPQPAPAETAGFKRLRQFEVRLDRLWEAQGYVTRQVHAFVTIRNISARQQYITSGFLRAQLADSDGVAQERNQVWRATAEPAALFNATPVVQPGAELKIRYVFNPDNNAQPASLTLREGELKAEFAARL